jgi:hypothetical protein
MNSAMAGMMSKTARFMILNSVGWLIYNFRPKFTTYGCLKAGEIEQKKCAAD